MNTLAVSMELAKKSYVKSYVDKRIKYFDTGGLGAGTYQYPELAGSLAVIFLFRYDSNNLLHTVLTPDSYRIENEFTITFDSVNQIILNNLDGTLKLHGMLAFY